MIRSLAYLVVRVLELALCCVGCLAPFICAPVLVLLELLREKLAPPPAPDRSLDLREFYSVPS